jgi:hypothetical protein
MDNKPILIQKMLLMSSYCELQNYMIKNYPGMVLQDDKVLFLECTLRAIMPKHIKKAGDQYKQMCGCQTCIISKNMFACVKMWQFKFVARERVNIHAMNQDRDKVLKRERLDEYIAKVRANECISPERVWDYVSGLACPKVEIHSNDEELPSRFFHKFGCCLGVCDNCPQWNNFIPQMQQDFHDSI